MIKRSPNHELSGTTFAKGSFSNTEGEALGNISNCHHTERLQRVDSSRESH